MKTYHMIWIHFLYCFNAELDSSTIKERQQTTPLVGIPNGLPPITRASHCYGCWSLGRDLVGGGITSARKMDDND